MQDVTLDRVDATRSDDLRAINDHARRTFIGCAIEISPAVEALPLKQRAVVLKMVRDFDEFDDEGNPFQEHDFGAFDFNGQRYGFRFEYFDPSMCRGASDPTDIELTRRVLTVHRSDER